MCIMGIYEGKRAVIYARVSTDDKDQKPEHQVGEIKKFCEREKIIIDEEFIDEKSGKNLDRPSFKKMMFKIFNQMDDPVNRIDLVVAWTVSRISRDQTDFLIAKRKVENMGAQFVFVDNPMDTTTTESQLLTSINAWVAQKERLNTVEHTKMGLRQARAEGKHLSKPFKVVYQEDIDNNCYKFKGELRFNDVGKYKTKIITEPQMLKWAEEGISVRKVATDKLGVSYNVLYKLMRGDAKRNIPERYTAYAEVYNRVRAEIDAYKRSL